MEETELSSLKVVKGEVEFSIARNEKGGWGKASVKAKDPHVQVVLEKESTRKDLLSEVEGLRVTDFMSQENVGTQGAGELVVTWTGKNKKSETWSIGAAADGKRKVWSKERGAVGEMKSDDIDAIEKMMATEPAKK